MLAVGVDAGATKTIAVLIDLDKAMLLAESRGGPANPASIGWDKALETIKDTIKEAIKEIRGSPEIIALSTAYTGWGRYIGRYEEYLSREFPGAKIHVYPDDIAALLSCYPEGEGIAFIMGTGSHCVAKYKDNIIRIGGWGHLLDDELGAYRIGRDAIVAVLKKHDGRLRENTILYDMFLEYMGVDNIYDAIDKIYSDPEYSKTIIAGFARKVLESVLKNDRIAISIIEDFARDFYEHLEVAINRLGLRRDHVEACIVGGVFKGSREIIEKYLVEECSRKGIEVSLREPQLRVECAVIADSVSKILGKDIDDVLKHLPRECFLR